MPLRPVTIERFPGVDLRNAPSEGAGAIDALNVSIDSLGDLRSRPGYALFVGGLSAGSHLARHVTSAGVNQLIVGSSSAGALAAFSAAGATISTSALGASANWHSSVQIGSPAATATYIAANATVVKWDGTSFTAPAGMPTAYVLGISPYDNRLVAAQTNVSPHRVQFSDPGAPETFGANNFVDLNPGDGEAVRALVTWQNLIFAFKRTKFFTFYGTSGDNAGNPIFNYRAVSTGVGLDSPAATAACAGPDGVYFVGPDGIYRTTGGSPQKISAQLDPFFAGATSVYWTGGSYLATNNSTARLAWVNSLLYASLPTGTGTSLMWVWDPKVDAWSPWGFRALGVVGFPPSTNAFDRLVPFFSIEQVIGKMDGTATTDAGTAITSRYRSAFGDMGADGEKKVRETLVHGQGTVTFQWSRDWGAFNPGTSDTVVLGTAPAYADGRHRKAMRGRLLSWQVSGSSPWGLQRLSPMLMGTRHAGAHTS